MILILEQIVSIKSYTSQGIGDITSAYNTSVSEFNQLANQINSALQSISFHSVQQQTQQPDYTIYYVLAGVVIILIL